MDERLESAKNPWGGRKFFPPGSHPATAQWREQVKALEAIPSSPQRDQMLDYAKDTLAKFEEGESMAKLMYLRACS